MICTLEQCYFFIFLKKSSEIPKTQLSISLTVKQWQFSSLLCCFSDIKWKMYENKITECQKSGVYYCLPCIPRSLWPKWPWPSVASFKCTIETLGVVFRPKLYLEIQIKKLVLTMLPVSHRIIVMFYFLWFLFVLNMHTLHKLIHYIKVF